MFDQNSYQGWGWNGQDWGWGRPCTPILNGIFGEPSVRKLDNTTWAMSYLNCETLNIVTRTAKGPDQVWSDETVQVTFAQLPSLYGGFIHPWSKPGKDNLHLMISQWTHDAQGHTTNYQMSQFVGTL